MRIALCASDFYAPVQQSIRDSGHEVSHVFTSCPIESTWSLKTAEFAKEMRAQFTVGAVTGEHIEQMKKEGVELLISAAYDYKVPVPSDETLKSVNLHGSLLPEGRGPWPSPHILLRHPEAAGMTLHTMTDEWDRGDILLQEKIEISAHDDSDSLIAKMVFLSGSLSKKLLSNFDRIWASRKPMEGKGSYWKKPTDSERTITPKDDPERISSIFRAFGKATLFTDGEAPAQPVGKVVIWPADINEPIGTLLASNNLQRIYAIRGGLLAVCN
jgi:methionyl-tRNA formyltransferase